jgi:hypothetical protein
MLVEAALKSGDRVYFRTEKRLAPADAVTITVPPERVLVYPLDTPAAPAAPADVLGVTP